MHIETRIMPINRTSSGFTILEVLIALLIFSLGLLGVAGMLVVSVQTNHSAYLRTQANFIAQGMQERMRANGVGVWKHSYDTTYSSATQGNPNTCISPSVCTYAGVAQRDGIVFSNQLAAFMPNATVTIRCVSPTAPSDDMIIEHTPYTGQCTMTMKFAQATLANQTTTPEQLDWVYQP